MVNVIRPITACLIALCFVNSQLVEARGFTGYEIKAGDINGDGIDDYLLDPPDKLVPVAVGDITVFVPAGGDPVMVLATPNDPVQSYYIDRDPSSATLQQTSNWQSADVHFTMQDYDGDDDVDFYFAHEQPMSDGAYGAIVYANPPSNSQISDYMVVDFDFERFVWDTTNYNLNPDYYALAGSFVSCYTSYSIGVDPFYNPAIEGWSFFPYFVGTTYCVRYWDPSVFSPWSILYSLGFSEENEEPETEEEEAENKKKKKGKVTRRRKPLPELPTLPDIIEILFPEIIVIRGDPDDEEEDVIITIPSDESSTVRLSCSPLPAIFNQIFGSAASADTDGLFCEIVTENLHEIAVEKGDYDGSIVTSAIVQEGFGVDGLIEAGVQQGTNVFGSIGLDAGSTGRVWCTYVKTRTSAANSRYASPSYYYGRTSGSAGLSHQLIVDRRSIAHHKNADGFGPATIDGVCLSGSASNWRSEGAYRSKRGREQKLIDQPNHQCAVDFRPILPEVGNEIRGVSRKRPEGCDYYQQSVNSEGNIAPFTGDRTLGVCAPRPNIPVCDR